MQEEAIRHFATTVAYRMNLNMARSADPAEVAAERRRFMRALRPVLEHDGPKIIVTDSQVGAPAGYGEGLSAYGSLCRPASRRLAYIALYLYGRAHLYY